MKTMLLNGSPKPNPKQSNTQLLTEAFIQGMQSPVELRRIIGSDAEVLAAEAAEYDSIILFFPLYIHSLPGHVVAFLQRLRPARSGQRLGFMIQAGFSETQQEQYVIPYLERLAQRLGYEYLGTVCKGECAAVCEMPKVFKTTIEQFGRLGTAYGKTGFFDKALVAEMAEPYELPAKQVKLMNFLSRFGVTNIFWNSAMRKNGCYKERRAKPFA